MSQPPPPPHVGQIVNGHQWNGQQWIPLSPQPPQQIAPQPYAALPTNKQKKPLLKRWWVWVGTAVVVLAVVTSIAGGGKPSPSTAASQVGATADTGTSSEPTEPATSEETPEDGSPSQAQASPEDSARSAMDDQFGSFEPLTKSGSGSSVVKLPKDAKAGMVTATHKGTSNFAVMALDSSNQATGDLLVNTIGRYSGTTAYGLSSMGDAVKLKIEANGSWTIKIVPLSKAPILSVPVSASGDKVFIYAGEAADWKITHKGRSNFAVIQYTDMFPNLMVNEIGNYSGTVPANAGPNVITIGADGAWSFKSA